MTLRARLAAIGLLVVTLVVLHTAVANAAASPAWRELGGSAHGLGLSQVTAPALAIDVSVAIGPDGHPIVAYTAWDLFQGTDAIVVQRWTGTAWQSLGGPAGVRQRYSTKIRVADTGTIYVGWLERDSGGLFRMHLSQWASAAAGWQPIEASDVSVVESFSLALDADGNPLVAFTAPAGTGVLEPAEGIVDGTGQVYVKRYLPATGWQYLGSDPSSGGGASNARSFLTGGAPPLIMHGAKWPSLAVDRDGAPVLAFTYLTTGADNTEIFGVTWDGSAWIALGPAVPQSDDGGAGRGGVGGISRTGDVSRNASLAASPTGALWLAWVEGASGVGSRVFVRQWGGTSWDEVGGSASGSGLGIAGRGDDYPSVAVQPQGADADAIVAWESVPAGGGGAQIFVKSVGSRLGDTFQPLGASAAQGYGISAAALNALAPMVAAAGVGAPVVVWHDIRAPGLSQAFLRQLSDFPLTVNVRGDGRVASTPSGIDCPGSSCVHEYALGQVVSLSATAGVDTLFEKWTGACSGAGACTVTLSAARAVNASFVRAATLTVAKSGTGAAFGTVNAPRIACGADCQEKYVVGTPVMLTVGVPAGTQFGGWGGDCASRGRNASCTLVMSGNRSVTAVFTQRVHRLAVAVTKPAGTVGRDGLGSVATTAGGVPLGTCGAGGTGTCVADLDYSTRVVLNAVAEAGNRFVSWQGTPCGGRTNATCELTLAGNTTVTALFRAFTAIQIVKAGNGQGTVNGPGLGCGADCTGEVFTNTSATVTFTPTTGTNFIQWEGGACDGLKRPSCTFFATGDSVTITARSELRRHRLTVTPRPNASVVSTTPLADAIDCGTDCTSTLDYGSLVGLRALPQPGLLFTRWTGTSPCSAGAQATKASCVFVLTGNATATPTYRTGTTVTLVKTGSGQGTVGISGTLNVGVSCSPLCPGATVQAFDKQPVKLHATASVGSTFTGFSGACTSPGPSCTFIPAGAAQNVSANFERQPRTVLVDIRGDGIVTGTSMAPDVVTCDASGCPVVGLYGQEVELTATPIPDNRFIAWSGCARANGSVCRVKLANPIAAPVNVTAIFSVSLTVQKRGDGTGTITGPGINCGTDCFETYTPGTTVILSQTPAAGSGFDGWVGDCVVLANASCRLLMNTNRVVDPAFGGPRTLTVVKTGIGNGTVTLSPPGLECGTTCTRVYPYRSFVTLTARPSAGSVVDFIPGCTPLGSPGVCGVNLAVDQTVEVPFNPPGSLSVQLVTGRDEGRVRSDDGLIDCGAGRTACIGRYPLGTVVRLTATAEAEGWIFAGWNGICAEASDNSCTLTVTDAQGAGVFFLAGTAVTIGFQGGGAGSVALEHHFGRPTCVSPGPCTTSVIYGSSVTLTPTPSSGVFGEWGGDCTGTPRNASCQIQVFGNASVTASFLLDPVAVQVAGSDDIAIHGADRTCSEPCERLFERGTVVAFDGVPHPGRVFTWVGDCASFGNASCLLEVAGDRSVSANVVVEAYELAVNVISGDFLGYSYAIVGDLGVCDFICSFLVPVGHEVTIQIVSDDSQLNTFVAFGGDCDGFEPVCVVTLDRDRAVDVYLYCGYYGCYFGWGFSAPAGRRQINAPDAVRLPRRPAVDAGLAAQPRVAAEAVVQSHAGGQQAAIDHDILARHEA